MYLFESGKNCSQLQLNQANIIDAPIFIYIFESQKYKLSNFTVFSKMDIQKIQSRMETISGLKQPLSSEQCTDSKRDRPDSDTSSRYQSIRKLMKKDILGDNSGYDVDKQEDKRQIEALKAKIGLQAIDEQHSVVSSDMPVRQKYGHLLPGYMGANYSFEQRKLLVIQNRLDEALDYLRLNREKTKGEFFSILKKNLLQLTFNFGHVKQICFLKPNFYSCLLKKNQNSQFDIWISLPVQADLTERKDQFRKSVYEFINRTPLKPPQQIRIPQHTFSFQVKQQTRQNFIQVMKPTKNPFEIFNKSNKQSRLNPFDAFRIGSTKFEQLLLAEVRQKQRKINEQKQKINCYQFSSEEILKILDEIANIFRHRDKSSMFKSTILLDLDKNLNYSPQFLNRVLDQIINEYSSFLKKIQHSSGLILQIQRKNYSSTRKELETKIMQEKMSKQNKQKQKVQEENNEKKENKGIIENLSSLKQIQNAKKRDIIQGQKTFKKEQRTNERKISQMKTIKYFKAKKQKN